MVKLRHVLPPDGGYVDLPERGNGVLAQQAPVVVHRARLPLRRQLGEPRGGQVGERRRLRRPFQRVVTGFDGAEQAKGLAPGGFGCPDFTARGRCAMSGECMPPLRHPPTTARPILHEVGHGARRPDVDAEPRYGAIVMPPARRPIHEPLFDRRHFPPLLVATVSPREEKLAEFQGTV